ncbi:MAG: hypothetical protein CL489_16585 [Acidobacteria bacterium]|nr:hypothetical protein [Acidobacteriota bacterium]|tara:strand:- start:1297 stop:2271 length:975 start_codon:yes stop_codon:yes gene_type:complete
MDKTLPKEYLDAIEYNLDSQERLGYEWMLPWTVTGMNRCVDPESKEFIDAVMKWQRKKKLKDIDGKIGPTTLREMEFDQLTPAQREVYEVIDEVAVFEAGGDYGALNLNTEYRFMKTHRAYQKIMIGLSAGIISFSQDGGALGVLLKRCMKRDPVKFAGYMGETYLELVEVTNRPGKSGLRTNTLRGPRVKPVAVSVGGHMERRDLWQTPWKEKFKKMLRDPAFKQVQREVAIELFLAKVLDDLERNNLKSEKMVAIAFNTAVHRGAGGAETWLAKRFVKGDDKATMKKIADDYHRGQSIIENDEISWAKWKGWKYWNGSKLDV